LKLLLEALKKTSTRRLKFLNAYLPNEVINDSIAPFVGDVKKVLMHQDCGGDIALRLLFCKDIEQALSVEAARMLLEAAPDAIKVVNKSGFAAIHSLVQWIKWHPEATILKDLIDIIPEDAFRLKGRYEMMTDCLTPLGMAVCPEVTGTNTKATRISVRELQLIIDSYPEALIATSDQGLVPLQFVAAEDDIPPPSQEICDIIVQKTAEYISCCIRRAKPE